MSMMASFPVEAKMRSGSSRSKYSVEREEARTTPMHLFCQTSTSTAKNCRQRGAGINKFWQSRTDGRTDY
jgi:hypothetical protein